MISLITNKLQTFSVYLIFAYRLVHLITIWWKWIICNDVLQVHVFRVNQNCRWTFFSSRIYRIRSCFWNQEAFAANLRHQSFWRDTCVQVNPVFQTNESNVCSFIRFLVFVFNLSWYSFLVGEPERSIICCFMIQQRQTCLLFYLIIWVR